MTGTLRQVMAPVHTWIGLIFGWVLYVIAVTGTAIVFRTEMDAWMRPETRIGEGVPTERALAAAHTYLKRHASLSESWEIVVPTEGRAVLVRWFDGRLIERWLDPRGEVLFVRETAGSQFIVDLHYTLHAGAFGLWLVALAGALMLIALVTGIILHKRILADIFLFRPGKGQRSWLDGHNVAGVLTLPFQFMIAASGLVFSLTTLMPAPLQALYREDEGAYFEESIPHFEREPSGQYAAPAALAPMWRRAVDTYGEAGVGLIVVHDPLDAASTIDLYDGPHSRLSLMSNRLTFDGMTGAELDRQIKYGGAYGFQSVLSGLHFGNLGDRLGAWLYFASGLATAILIATGLILWTVKREARGQAVGRVVRMNAALIWGAPAVLGGLFLANRLLPVTLQNRAAAEVSVALIAAGVAVAIALFRPRSTLWGEGAALNALLLIAALGLAQSPFAVAGFGAFDAVLAVGGLLFAGLGAYLRLQGRTT